MVRVLHDVPAPAKLNLFLHVVGRRADGYHLLQTVFRFVDLADSLYVEATDDGRIERLVDVPRVDASSDLTIRAARALQQACGVTQGCRIGLNKQIPTGGGLGGGSSDAASTLMALNRLWGCGLDREALVRLALPLGADVPVFVFGQSAFAQGIGEQLSPISLPERAYVIAQPDASVPTPTIFRDPDLTRNTPCVKIADFLAYIDFAGGVWPQSSARNSAQNAGESKGSGCAEGMAGNSYFDGAAASESAENPGIYPTVSPFHNDLEGVAYTRFPEVGRAARWFQAWLDQAVPEEVAQVRMSGSGACLFSEHTTLAQARKVAEGLRQAALAKQEIAATMRSANEVLGVCPQFRMIHACHGLSEHPLRHWL